MFKKTRIESYTLLLDCDNVKFFHESKLSLHYKKLQTEIENLVLRDVLTGTRLLRGIFTYEVKLTVTTKNKRHLTDVEIIRK